MTGGAGFSAALSEALCGALVHSVWQGAVAGVALALAGGWVRSAEWRYRAALGALCFCCLSFGLTLGLCWPASGDGLAASWQRTGGLVTSLGATMAATPALWDRLVPWLPKLWMAGASLMVLWRGLGWTATERLRRRMVWPAPVEWQQRVAELGRRMGIDRSVRVLESGLAKVPLVIGHLKPVVLLPAGLLVQLSAGELEAILLHELAHIRRADYLWNLLAAGAECLLFYHPAVWWISHRLRTERELCSDDLAVAALGDRAAYAAALLQLETYRGGVHEPALAATGGNLMLRIHRLLSPAREVRPIGAFPVVAAGMLAAFALLLAGQQAETAKESPYAKWLNRDVVYIIEPAEREAFVRLTTDQEREQFIKQFWERRNPTPGNPGNAFRNEHYRRIAYANERFSGSVTGWRTDRGRTYIVYGPPDEIEVHANERRQSWLYRSIDGIGERVVFRFTDPGGRGDYAQDGPPTPLKK